jgi:hypothetical protein
MNSGKIDQSECRRDPGADNQPDQNRNRAHETPEKPVDQKYKQQRSSGERDVPEACEIRGSRVTAAGAHCRHRNQRDADNCYDRSGHDRRKQVQ